MLELTKGKYFILLWHTIFLHICVCMNRDSGLNLYSTILIFGKHPSTLTAFELEAYKHCPCPSSVVNVHLVQCNRLIQEVLMERGFCTAAAATQ